MIYQYMAMAINSMRPRQNGRHLPDDIFKCIFLNENVWISLKISLKFVPRIPINNIPALVQIMAWHRPGDKPLSEPMVVSLLMHICVTRPQWVNTLRLTQNCCHFTDDGFKIIFFNENVWISLKISLNFVLKGQINNIPALVQIMTWRWPDAKPLSDQWLLIYWHIYASPGLNELSLWGFNKSLPRELAPGRGSPS